jgi:hypothetical protein
MLYFAAVKTSVEANMLTLDSILRVMKSGGDKLHRFGHDDAGPPLEPIVQPEPAKEAVTDEKTTPDHQP